MNRRLAVRLSKLEDENVGGLALFIIQPCHPDEQARIRELGRKEGRRIIEIFSGVCRGHWGEPWAVQWL